MKRGSAGALHWWLGYYGVVAVFGLQGCFAYFPIEITDTTRPVRSLDDIQVVGAARGESCTHFILGFPVASEPPMSTAYERAKRQVAADAMMNVSVDGVSRDFLLYQRRCVSVRGNGIRYVR